jgi:Domain of unknown function (DUF5606)
MKLDKLVAVSGLPGIFRAVGQNKNGIIVQDIASGLNRFIPTRGHNLSPLDTISIYVQPNDSIPIKTLFENIKANIELAMPKSNDSHEVYKKYFEVVLPEYDRERVHYNDMKKAVRWFSFLNEKGLLEDVAEEETVVEGALAEAVGTADEAQAITEKPASKKKETVKEAATEEVAIAEVVSEEVATDEAVEDEAAK